MSEKIFSLEMGVDEGNILLMVSRNKNKIIDIRNDEIQKYKEYGITPYFYITEWEDNKEAIVYRGIEAENWK